MSAFVPTLGLEEELFLTEPTRPSLNSLYYMARLMARNPRDYYKHSATNFARGQDIQYGLMSTVEIATRPHADPDTLIEELARRRQEFASVVDNAYIVSVGHLFDIDAPTNTGGLHLHIGIPLSERERVYANLAYFLPLLSLLTVSSPYVSGGYFGQSYRMARSFAIGELRADPYYRFQDLILSRRLGTIEIRLLDPVWDLERVRWLVRAVWTIAQCPETYPLDQTRYAELRRQAFQKGYTPDLQRLYGELARWVPIPETLFQRTVSDDLAEWTERHGLLSTYACLDSAYRTGVWQRVEPRPLRPLPYRALLGLLGYYLPRLPYTAYKAWAEWKRPQPNWGSGEWGVGSVERGVG